MKQFGGKVLFLDRSDINTDEIIPAKYLTEITREALKPYLLEDLKLSDATGRAFDPHTDLAGKAVLLTRANFGCGSSREHAPWALEANGIHVVIAESFARIFRQNMYNCGMLAIELSPETIQGIFTRFGKGEKEVSASFDLDKNILTLDSAGEKSEIPFKLEGFDRDLITSGGWLDYVEDHY
jgi:3-isopropylmalate/(R)-2-methylmalate dehydratase small subunit